MTSYKNIYYYTSNIIKLIKNYTNIENHTNYNYHIGLNEINKILSLCYLQLENVYYTYFLRPSLLDIIKNNNSTYNSRNSD
jgi:hypothetical protein